MKILVSALEHSANIHLKSLLHHLPEDTELLGIFDKDLGEPIVDLQAEAVMGYVDAIKKIGFYLKLAKQMVDLADKADKILLIDSSGFNLPLSKKIKNKYPNKEIIYYILPEAWAWKKGRIKKLENRIDTLASILPFEKEYYAPDINIRYIGHPLLDQIKEFKTAINDNIETITYMPGSRKSIIRKLMPIFRDIAGKLKKKAIVVIPNHFSQEETNELYGNLKGFRVERDGRKALLESDFAFICKGTATLEASLIGTPFVLVYKFAFLDYIVYKLLVKIKFIGLGNILLKAYQNRVLHPELIQHEVIAQNLIGTMQAVDRRAFYHDSLNLIEYLQHGSAKNIAKIITKKKT
ncbi:MAG: lipid-A-disaccharide synthase [Sulfurovum sp.]|nr:lipid-A-disaccharide synthase [Sulfurovum sp.]